MRERKDFKIFGKPIKIEMIEEKNGIFVGKYKEKPIYILSSGEIAAGGEFKAMAMIERGEKQIPIAAPSDEYGKDICYECNILHALGSNFQSGDKLFPKFEKTGGAVMFTEKNGRRKYLLIKNESGHIGFPKGHIEYGETEEETAAREVMEETGLVFKKFGDFREEYTYTTRENCIKTGAFFISHYDYKVPTIQQEEILDDWLLSFDRAMEKLNFPEDRDLLEKADRYITEKV